MNPWQLRKSPALKRLLLRLQGLLGAESFRLLDHWPEQPEAIGLCSPDDPATFAFLYLYGQEPGRYGLHLEYPHTPGDPLVEVFEGLDLRQLVETLAAHLDIAHFSLP